jgi:hypothetical protein
MRNALLVFPGVCMALSQGACVGLRELALLSDYHNQPEILTEQMHCLVGALEAEGALSALEELRVGGGELPADTAYILLEALRRGAVPNLRKLSLKLELDGEAGNIQDDAFEDIIFMLEERRRLSHLV